MPVLGHVLKHLPRPVLRHVPGHVLEHVPKHVPGRHALYWHMLGLKKICQ